MTKQDCEMEWMRLRYPEGMGNAKFGLLPPDHNFVRAYHLTSAKHAESNITRRRLKVARFSEVNDPFELMALNFHKRETRQLVTRFKDLYNSNTGLLCFSKNWTNPLLWSHYADRHKGICLGFDLSRGDVQEVSYVEKRLRMQDEDPHSIPQDLKISCSERNLRVGNTSKSSGGLSTCPKQNKNKRKEKSSIFGLLVKTCV